MKTLMCDNYKDERTQKSVQKTINGWLLAAAVYIDIRYF